MGILHIDNIDMPKIILPHKSLFNYLKPSFNYYEKKFSLFTKCIFNVFIQRWVVRPNRN
jgi:hypothetical protein